MGLVSLIWRMLPRGEFLRDPSEDSKDAYVLA
jgi:hypothetical protein